MLFSILTAFAIVTGIIMLVDFVEATRNFDEAEISGLNLLWLTILKTPSLIEETIAFVVLFGVMWALYNLNRRSELIIMRTSGLSAWRFLTPAIVVTALIGVFWTAVLNRLAAEAIDLRERVIAEVSDRDTFKREDTSIWLRDGTEFEQTVIFAPRSDLLSQTLHDAEFNVFELGNDGQFQFARRFDAAKAALLPSGYWQLTDVVENTADAQKRDIDKISWPTTITKDTLQKRSRTGTLPPFWELPGEISDLSKAGFSSTLLEMRFHELLALPLMLVAMTLLAAAVSMRLSREGGTLQLLLAGGVLGFGVYFLQSVIGTFGKAGAINLCVAVWIVPSLVMLAATAYLSHLEDG